MPGRVEESIRDVIRSSLLSEEEKGTLVTPQNARVGLKITTSPGRWDAGDWVIRKMTKKSITIGSNSGVDVGPKFAGRTFMYRWDGKGFIRQKQYVYVWDKKQAED